MTDLQIMTMDELVNNPSYHNEVVLYDNIIYPLYQKVKNEEFVGNGTVEILCRQLVLDPRQPFLDFKGVRKTNVDYCKKELDWYLSEDLSIKGHVDDVKIWVQCATKDDKQEINSNYGYLVFSKENGYQYQNVLKELTDDKLTRNGIIMYNRPSIHTDYLRDGMHDMICTLASHFLIRNNKLEMIHYFRSNDIFFGFLNDLAWNCFVYQNMYLDLKKVYPELEYGKIYWTSDSMHCYERHYKFLERIVAAYEEN